MMPWQADDGGRAAAGYRGHTGDCAARAVAIAAGIPYQDAYDQLNLMARRERPRGTTTRSHARTGVHATTMHRVLEALGFAWTATMHVGGGCRVHLRAGDLPAGRLVVRVSRHYVAVVDGVIHDTHDPGREGTRCVYGYWRRATAGAD